MSDPVRPVDDSEVRARAGESSPPTPVPSSEGPGAASLFVPAREPSPTRQLILDVARELFASRGFERTPLRAISDSLE